MKPLPLLAAVLGTLTGAARLTAADPDGYAPLFNGKDLAGWVNVNCAPGTFFVKGDEIVTTGNPTGFLRTEKQYENFVLELEWMHVNQTAVANSGLFVWGDPLPAVGSPYTRGIEVQVLINYPKTDWATNHGDVFAIWGATCVPDRQHPKGAMRCLPSEERVKGAGQWNHYKVVATDGVIKLHVNGKEVSGVSKCSPRKGYLALESEGAECHFRNIKIKELPSTNPKADAVAKEWEGHTSLFTGVDLSGWKTEEGACKAEGGHLKCTGKADLVTRGKYGPCELVFDCKLPAKSTAKWAVELGNDQVFRLVDPDMDSRGKWNRVVVTIGRDGVSYMVNAKPKVWSNAVVSSSGPITFKPVAGLELMNIFVRELKGN